jgi:hypothetical protein
MRYLIMISILGIISGCNESTYSIESNKQNKPQTSAQQIIKLARAEEGYPLSFTSKYIITTALGRNRFDFAQSANTLKLNEQVILVSGSDQVDEFVIQPGNRFDLTNTKGSIDKIYFLGDFVDYASGIFLDPDSGVIEVIRNLGLANEELVKVIGANTASDVLVFTDGAISTQAIKNALIANTSLLSLPLDSSLTSLSLPVINQSSSASVKAIALDDQGETFFSFGSNIELAISGSSGVDKVYISPGHKVDASNLKASQDEIYFLGSWDGYLKEITESGNLRLSRNYSIAGQVANESVLISSGSTVATNDLLVFSDGAIATNDAYTALQTDINIKVSKLSALNPNVTTPVSEQTVAVLNDDAIDFDQDGLVNGIDPDDDNDGLLDINDEYRLNPLNALDSDADGVADLFDAYPNDAGNIIDTDADGVADRFDVFPNDPTQTKAVVVDLAGAESIGLGEALAKQGGNAQLLPPALRQGKPKPTSIFDQWISKAYAAGSAPSISNLTNAIAWDEQGQVLNGSILSSETLFVAEAGLTPDGRFLYLLTSKHIQRALDGIDDEVCSIYRVDMRDYGIECLLSVDLGDIEPGSIKGTMQTDYSRSGIDFRSDGAAVMTGFDWAQELPSGVNGGTNSTIAWVLNAEGEITSLLHDEGYFAVSALWLNDEYFVVAEYPFLGQDGPIMPGREGRIVIYNASDLTIHKRITAQNIWGPTVRADGDLFWQYGGALNGTTLETFDSPIQGIPVTDNNAAKVYGLVDYAGVANSLSTADKSIDIPLSDGVATSYEWRKGSGTGTDINYKTFAFTDDFLAYIKSYGAAEPIVSIDGHALTNGGLDINLSDGRGRFMVGSNLDQFYIAPSSAQEDDLVITYQVNTDEGIVSRTLTITEQTIANWRIDSNRPSVNSDARFEDAAIKWASPSPEREGICIYQFENDTSVCGMPTGNVAKTDMETFRSTRYDADAVYPDGMGNAYPGIRNVFIDNGRLRVFYKDTDTHQYYQAIAPIDQFLIEGARSFRYEDAVNGQGEQNIITAAVDLKPKDAKLLDGTITTLISDNQLTLRFPQALSKVAITPKLVVEVNGVILKQQDDIQWNDNRTIATILLSNSLEDSLKESGSRIDEVIVRTHTPLFIVDSTQQYMLNEDDFVTGVAPIETLDTDGDGIVNELDTDDDNDGVADVEDFFPYNRYEIADSDGDGVGDNADLFPLNASETRDTDEDGFGNNIDAFPLDETEWLDSDGDGYGDNKDKFPFDKNEWKDTDADGVGDNGDFFPLIAVVAPDTDADGVTDSDDLFPNNPLVYRDSDGDGVGNRLDAFPYDSSETSDADGDGYGDNSDAFPFNFDEGQDRDNDGFGDNQDAFPDDSSEWYDSDGDGVGDNMDLFPYDPYDGEDPSEEQMQGYSEEQNAQESAFEQDQYSCGRYCSESGGLFYYHFALNGSTELFPIHLGGADVRLEYAGGGSEGAFVYTNAADVEVIVDVSDLGASPFLGALNNNAKALRLARYQDASVDNSFIIYDGETKIGVLNLVANANSSVTNIKQLYPKASVSRVLTGTGSRQDNQCTEIAMENLAQGISQHGQISLVPDDVVAGGAMDLLGMGTENSFYVCEDTPIGIHHIIMQALDGRGGKKTMPLSVTVTEDSVSGGQIQWRDCGNVYCQFVDSQFYYHFALEVAPKTYPFHLYADKFSFAGAGGASNAGFLLYDSDDEPTRIFSSYTQASDVYIPMDLTQVTAVIQAEKGSLTMSLNADEQIDNSFGIFASKQEIGRVNLVANESATVFELTQQYTHLYINPVKPRTGTRQYNKCSEFGIAEFALGLQSHGQISLVPDDLIRGGSMDLMGFGGESSVYVCQDTPAGEYDIRFTAVDGLGGKRYFDLTVIVASEQVEGGAIRWE